MRKLLFAVVAVLMVIPFGEGRGANIDISEPLTLNQCIKLALEQSPSMRMAALDLKTAEFDVADARSNYWPQINASGQYRFSEEIDFGWEPQNYDASLNASYTIWDHGRREAGLAQARLNEKGVQSDYENSKQSLIYSVTEAYYALLETEKLIDVNEKLLEISKGNVEKVTAFQEAGRSIPADVAAARVQQANDELSVINAQNNLELARARLASLMGLDPGTPIGVVDEDAALVSPDADRMFTLPALLMKEVSLEDSLAEAMEKRSELVRLRIRLASLEWSLRLARLDRWPVITAEYGYNVQLDDYLRDRGNFKEYRDWSAVARVSFPIFDGGVSKRREQSAEIALQQMEESMSERERSIKLEVQQAYLNLERAKKSLEIAKEQVTDATESLNVTQGRYEQTMVIFLEVLSAQARYAQALTNQVRAFYDLKITQKALEKAVGTLKVED
jgi:outer membrane protein